MEKEEIRCPFCGTKIEKIIQGKYYCPNHGMINIDREQKDENREVDYIG